MFLDSIKAKLYLNNPKFNENNNPLNPIPFNHSSVSASFSDPSSSSLSPNTTLTNNFMSEKSEPIETNPLPPLSSVEDKYQPPLTGQLEQPPLSQSEQDEILELKTLTKGLGLEPTSNTSLLNANAPPVEWEFVQSFGDDSSAYDSDDADDLVTAVQFNHTGEFFAIGDKAGRVSIVQEEYPSGSGQDLPLAYRFYTEFQSHDPDFDVLKSQAIEPKLNVIRFWHRLPGSLHLLTCNDKTIKFWKLTESPTGVRGYEGGDPEGDENQLPMVQPMLRRNFSNGHSYNIHSLSVNCDGETFLSADDLKILMWNVDNVKETFNVVDLQPPEPEPITELLTCASFHPTQCHSLLYATSKGVTRLCDLRARALVDRSGVEFGPEPESHRTAYFSEITQSVLHAQFAGEHQFICRDYMSLRCWDAKMPRQPLYKIDVHPYLEPHFPRLLENESLFDHFECAVSNNGKYFATGTYANSFHLHDTTNGIGQTIRARDDSREPYITSMCRRSANSNEPTQPIDRSLLGVNNGYIPPQHVMNYQEEDLHHNIVNVAFHPRVHAVAAAGLYKLYLYQPRPSSLSDVLLPE